MYRKTRVIIDLDIIAENMKTIVEKYDNYEYYIAVVKSCCYGHGELIIPELIKNGINYLAVSSLDEALSIRKKYYDIPIICLEPIDIDELAIASFNDITLTVHDYEYWKKVKRKKINIQFHIKLDTGMNRIGIKSNKELEAIIKDSFKNDYLNLEGIYTHFATASSNKLLLKKQIKTFYTLMSNIDISKIKIIHAFNSDTLLVHEKLSITNGVRLGLIMYGAHNASSSLKVKEAFSLLSKVIQVKKVKKGEFVSYDSMYKAKKDVFIATIPIGYADGFERNNQKRYIAINSKRYKIIGKICMDMLMVEVDNTVKTDDSVILIGKNVNLNYVCKYLKCSPYEIFTGISDRVTRVYMRSGIPIKAINFRTNL